MEMISLELYSHPFAECFTLNQNYRIPRVMRDDACLAYIQSGQQEIYSQSHKIIAKDKESILMKCGNYIANFTDVSPTNQFKSVVFHLDPESIKKAFGEKDLSFLRVNKNPSTLNPALKIDRSELLDSFVASMMPYFDNPKLVKEELLAVKLQELVYILSDSGKNPIATQIIGTLYAPEEFSFHEIISANLFNKLSIAEFAHLTARSESKFKRDFKKLYNDSPANYFKSKRLEKAAELLRSTNKQVNEIAWECGFESPAHFSDSFHNHFSKSPRNYRN